MLTKTQLTAIRFPRNSRPRNNVENSLIAASSFSLYDALRSYAKLFAPTTRVAPTSSVASSTTETTLFSYSVPATFSPLDILQIKALLRTKNDSGSSITFTTRLKVNGNTRATATTAIADATDPNYGILDATLFSSATNFHSAGKFIVGNGTITPLVSTTSFAINPGDTITVTMQMSASDAEGQFELLGGSVKLVD